MRRLIIIAAALALVGCSTLSAPPLPSQAATLAEAVQIADLATNVTHTAVDTVKLPRATLVELSALNDSLHAAVVSLEQANASGQTLNFAAFNAALSAYNAYAVANGVKP